VIHAGGFLGRVQSGNHFINCYALGNVVVGSLGHSDINAGGFAGRAPNSNISFSRCFSTGLVYGRTQKSVGISGTATEDGAWLGGFVGYMWGSGSDRISDCVVLGASITNRSPTNTNAYRIYSRCENDEVNTNNNYAIDSIQVRRGPFFINDPLTNVNITTSDAVHNGRHGRTVHDVDRYNPNFWRIIVNFSDTIWDFSTIASRGHPILRGVEGQ